MTDRFHCSQRSIEIEHLDGGPDLLAKLMEDVIELEETDAPGTVITPLFKYSHLLSLRLTPC